MVLAVTTVIVAVSMNMFPSVPPKVDVMATGVEPLIMVCVFLANGSYNGPLSLEAYFGYEMIGLIAVRIQAKSEQFQCNFSLILSLSLDISVDFKHVVYLQF